MTVVTRVALNKKGNLIIRNRRHLILTNKKFNVKYNYENIIQPNEITSPKTIAPPRTDISSNTVAPLGNQKDVWIKR